MNDQQPERKKPVCELIGQDGNIFNLLGIAGRTLKENGLSNDSDEMYRRVTKEAADYYDALAIIGEYVNITGPDEDIGMEDIDL